MLVYHNHVRGRFTEVSHKVCLDDLHPRKA